MARVQLSDVCKTYAGGVPAVRGVSLDIADREFLVLVGPSGCGKSTTLRMVAGLEDIDAGTIRIGERVVNDVPARDRNIAMVFQNYALYPHMTVSENLAFALKVRGLPRRQIADKVRETARVLGIEDLLQRKPAALSGGQRQRVAVGRALVRSPACFLFDEPLSNLDAQLRTELRVELKRLHQEVGATTLYVTHDQEEAMTLADRVVVMHGGRIQQCDEPLHLYRHPRNRFVAGFVGTMNFWPGHLRTGEGGLWFHAGQVRLLVPAWAQASLGKLAERALVLGLRPEALGLAGGGRFGGGEIPGRVLLIEPLGDRMNVHLQAAGEGSPALLARVDADSALRPHAELRLYVDEARLHFFAADAAGENLALGAEP